MSLSQTRSLLQEYNIIPNKLLGQNFMIDSSVYPKLSNYVSLNTDDSVLDAGAGFGFLTLFLSDKCKRVITVEKDPKVAQVLRKQVKSLTNVTVIEGNVLKVSVPEFNKAVSIPPYYLSSQLLTWLLDRTFDCAALIVQKEFANRLVAPVASENYGWLTVFTAQATQAELLDEIPNWMFYPQPEVDSIILRLTPLKTPPFTVKNLTFFRRLTKWLFTQRNKKLDNALTPFIRSELKLDKSKAVELASSMSLRNKRARDLSPSDFGELADELSK
ncbi:MAG: 16S rRNA (adenine(1518)-N(6)/adenine(1519)-N(6))-dimethyltransferase RsmA [Candidatus Bathyarchaeota archaeon]|nr:16S rRNA (adenine(1518)-N(6)/adenine(1519)-N(6))-dimethyltransferase RsmA [Candidatus Bathyarchaeota archaeon]